MIMLAIASATITKKLGAYYLIGAFVVGLIARRFVREIPGTSFEQMLHAIKSFSFFFVPFYFFKAGISASAFVIERDQILLGLGLGLLVACFRILTTMSFMIFFLKVPKIEAFGTANSTLPTLIFGLVLTGILYERFNLRAPWPGALIVATLFLTLLPITLRRFHSKLLISKQPAVLIDV